MFLTLQWVCGFVTGSSREYYGIVADRIAFDLYGNASGRGKHLSVALGAAEACIQEDHNLAGVHILQFGIKVSGTECPFGHLTEPVYRQQICFLAVLIRHTVTGVIDYGTSFAVVGIKHVSQPIDGEVHLAQSGIRRKADMVIGDAQGLLAIHLEDLAIVIGEGYLLFVFIMFVGYDDHECLIVGLTVDGYTCVYRSLRKNKTANCRKQEEGIENNLAFYSLHIRSKLYVFLRNKDFVNRKYTFFLLNSKEKGWRFTSLSAARRACRTSGGYGIRCSSPAVRKRRRGCAY